MSKKLTTRLMATSLAIIIPLAGAAAANADTPQTATQDQASQNQVNEQLQKIGTPEWNADIQKLKDQGRIKETNHTEGTDRKTTTYQVNDPETGDRIGDFTVTENKTSERIGGTFDGGIPAIVFNQEDQKALKTGGAGAVTAMASAWAAALAETVVGSVLSAGAIALIGGTATYYLSQNGLCPDNKNLVVNALKQAHCG